MEKEEIIKKILSLRKHPDRKKKEIESIWDVRDPIHSSYPTPVLSPYMENYLKDVHGTLPRKILYLGPTRASGGPFFRASLLPSPWTPSADI